MRVFVDLIETLTNGLRAIVGLFVLLVFGTIMAVTYGASHVATTAAEEMTAEAGELGREAIRAQQQAERERALAKDGWGYGSASDGFGEETGPEGRKRKRRSRDDDWGEAN